MVQQAVEDGGGDHGVAKDLAPGAQALIAGQDDRAPLVAARDQLKEEIGALAIDGDVADLVDDQQLGLRQDLQPFVEAALGEGFPERGDEPRGGGKQDADAVLAGLQPRATARCVLPTPGGPRSRTLSPVSRYRPVASSRITFGSIDGWNLKSKASSVF